MINLTSELIIVKVKLIISIMYESNTYRSMAAPVNTNQQYYSQQLGNATGNIETHYTLSTMADPYALYMQKRMHMINNYARLNGGKPAEKVMKQTGQNPAEEQALQNRFGFDKSRYTNEDFKNVGDLLWKGLQGFSRFYAQDKIKAQDERPSNYTRFNAGNITDKNNSDDDMSDMSGIGTPVYRNTVYNQAQAFGSGQKYPGGGYPQVNRLLDLSNQNVGLIFGESDNN